MPRINQTVINFGRHVKRFIFISMALVTINSSSDAFAKGKVQKFLEKAIKSGALIEAIETPAPPPDRFEFSSDCYRANEINGQAINNLSFQDAERYRLHRDEVCKFRDLSKREQTANIHANARGLINADEPQRAITLLLPLTIDRTSIANRAPLEPSETLLLLSHAYRLNGEVTKSLSFAKAGFNERIELLGKNHLKTVLASVALGNAYAASGSFPAALQILEAALQQLTSSLGSKHHETLSIQKALIPIHEALGNGAAAQRALSIVISTNPNIDQSLNGEKIPFLVDNWKLQRLLGESEKAEATIQNAIDLSTQIHGQNHPKTSELIVLRSRSGTGGQGADLENTLRRIYLDRQHTLGRSSDKTVEAGLSLSIATGNSGKKREAISLQRELLNSFSSNQSDGSFTKLKLLEELATNLLAQQDTADSIKVIFLFVAEAEKLRSSHLLRRASKIALFSEISNTYKLFSLKLAQIGDVNHAFFLADLGKARTLSEEMSLQYAKQLLPIDRAEQLETLEGEITKSRSTIEELLTRARVKTGPEIAYRLSDALGRSNELNAKLQEFRSTHLDVAMADIQVFTAETTALKLKKANIADNEIFISYLTLGNGQTHAYTLNSKNVITSTNLGKLTHLSETVALFRNIISGKNANSRGALIAYNNGRFHWHSLSEPLQAGGKIVASDAKMATNYLQAALHAALLKPISATIKKSTKWIISPDGDLALIPWDLLAKYDERAELTNNLTSISLVQSFFVFNQLKARKMQYQALQRDRLLLAIGDPVFQPNTTIVSGLTSTNEIDRNALQLKASAVNSPLLQPNFSIETERFYMKQLQWAPIKGTAREIEGISQTFKTAYQGTRGEIDFLMGASATEQTLATMNDTKHLRRYKYIVFSTHGYLAKNHELSSIVLSQTGNAQGFDGYLTSEKLARYKLQSDLVVLSACETAVGKVQTGEGVMGLPFALLIAGNQNMLLSLWPIDDNATADFMIAFFDKIAKGADQAEALAKTKMEFSKNSKWAAPYYWAGFVLYGV
jgi:CHAT domain-containing protein/plasmid maintenance system antidote protein VapI